MPTSTLPLPPSATLPVDPPASPAAGDGTATTTAATATATESRRTLANRQNAQRSTGPRTPEGKARSRANALKHGLAGAGVCLPGEDAALVQERCLLLHEELAPQSVRGMMLVEALALAHTRMKRAARQEVAVLSHKQRHAAAAFDDARLTQAEDDLDQLGGNIVTRYRHLMACPEGVDLLLARLGDVRQEIRNPTIRWNYIHGICLERFCGRDYSDKFTRSRGRALSLALEFDPSELTAEDRAAIGTDDVMAVQAWAKVQMEALIDGEIAQLVAHRATLDHAGIARDRAEAADSALFDPSRDAALARRYEAAAGRTFLRILKELRTIAAEDAAISQAAEATPSALDPPTPAVAEVLEAGDALTIAVVDPADRAAEPAPPRRVFERPPLASFGITAEQASREISQPHADRPPVPVHLPVPAVVGVAPPRRPASR